MRGKVLNAKATCVTIKDEVADLRPARTQQSILFYNMHAYALNFFEKMHMYTHTHPHTHTHTHTHEHARTLNIDTRTMSSAALCLGQRPWQLLMAMRYTPEPIKLPGS